MRKFKILPSVIISLSLFFFMGVCYLLYKDYRHDVLTLKCEADVLSDVYDGGEKYTLDALYVLALVDKNQGFLHISGVLKNQEKKEELDRTYNFSFKNNDKIGIYGVKIYKEKVSSYDTVNSKFFHTYFLPDRLGEDFYIKASSPDKGLYLFEGFSYPFFMCSSGS